MPLVTFVCRPLRRAFPPCARWKFAFVFVVCAIWDSVRPLVPHCSQPLAAFAAWRMQAFLAPPFVLRTVLHCIREVCVWLRMAATLASHGLWKRIFAICAQPALERIFPARILPPFSAVAARRIAVAHEVVLPRNERIVLDGVQRPVLAFAQTTCRILAVVAAPSELIPVPSEKLSTRLRSKVLLPLDHLALLTLSARNVCLRHLRHDAPRALGHVHPPVRTPLS